MVKPDDQETRDERTDQKILDAADRVFLRRGTDGARMQEIADEAGVNKALLHYYYRSKEKLAEAVFRRVAGGLLPAVLGILSSDMELEEKVEQVVHRYLDQLARRPYLPGYLISEVTHHPDRLPNLIASVAGRQIEQIRREIFRAIGRQIEERVRAGTLAPITPEQFIVNLVSLCIFPFAARPILMMILGLDAKGFEWFIEERRRELPEYIKRALRP